MYSKSWLRFRVPLGFLLAAWYLYLVKLSAPRWLMASAFFVVWGCALRSWAAGYLLKGKRVATGGPYAYVRNPLYLGSFILGIGFCLALFRTPLPPSVVLFWAIFFLGFWAVYRAKSLAEERELIRSLGPSYQDYRKQVPAFLPVRGKVGGLGMQRFSGELYRRNREYRCVLGAVLVLMFLFWRVYGG